MKNSSVRAIVLKRSNFSEADRIITLFSRQRGKIKVVAKGSRRIKSRRAPHLELFNLVDLVLHQGKVFDLVTEAKSLKQYAVSKSDLTRTSYLFYLAEVLDKILPEEQPHPEVFDILCRSLLSMETSDNPQKLIKESVVEILWGLGYLPRGNYPKEGVTDFVEQVVETKIRSKKFVEAI